MKSPRQFRNRKRGSLLIVAMLLCAVIGISLASYINLGRSNLQIANRALYNNAAMNLAENGLEEAMYSINKANTSSTYNWASSGWTISGANASRTLGPYTLDQGVTGYARVYVAGYAGSTPQIFTRSTIRMGGGSSREIEKWLEVQVRRTSQFAYGLAADTSITFSGNNAYVDSWNSDHDNNSSTPGVGYNSTNGPARDKGPVGADSVTTSAISVQNADIWGKAATTGSSNPPTVGPNGRVGPYGTALGTVANGAWTSDFSANFEVKSNPSISGYTLGSINNDLQLPRSGDTMSGGKYYYTATDIDLVNKVLTIQPRVAGDPAPTVIITLTSGLDAIKIGGGSGEIKILSNSMVEIYTAGNIDVAGNGITNGTNVLGTAAMPINLQIWGTKTSPTPLQDIKITGNGVFSGVINAPKAAITFRGNAEISGAALGNTIELKGNGGFHYDESLAKISSGNPFRVASWVEHTTQAARQAIAGNLSWALP